MSLLVLYLSYKYRSKTTSLKSTGGRRIRPVAGESLERKVQTNAWAMTLPREDDANQVPCLIYQPGKETAFLGIHFGRGLDN